VAAVVQSLD